MALSKEKKRRKIDAEKRRFNDDWTEKYAHMANAQGIPMCLLCYDFCSVNKEYNFKRHFSTTHGSFDNEFPLGSEARRTKLKTLIQNYERSSTTLFRACHLRQNAMAASLRVAWILAKKKRPFTDSERMHACCSRGGDR